MAALTRNQFIAALAPAVIRVKREGSHIFPSVRLAQNVLETGGVLHSWNNLGGIKVGNGKPNRYWHGEAVVKGTWEYIDGRDTAVSAAFRAYKSVYHFYKDLDLLLAGPRYARVLQAQTPEQQSEMLQASGYATDPAYASKLNAIIKVYNLKRYDAMAEQAIPRPVKLQAAESVAVLHQDLYAMADGYLQSGATWVAARTFGERIGAVIGWTGTQVKVNGIAVETILSEATGYVLKPEWFCSFSGRCCPNSRSSA
jgi:hypothetical protein